MSPQEPGNIGFTVFKAYFNDLAPVFGVSEARARHSIGVESPKIDAPLDNQLLSETIFQLAFCGYRNLDAWRHDNHGIVKAVTMGKTDAHLKYLLGEA